MAKIPFDGLGSLGGRQIAQQTGRRPCQQNRRADRVDQLGEGRNGLRSFLGIATRSASVPRDPRTAGSSSPVLSALLSSAPGPSGRAGRRRSGLRPVLRPAAGTTAGTSGRARRGSRTCRPSRTPSSPAGRRPPSPTAHGKRSCTTRNSAVTSGGTHFGSGYPPANQTAANASPVTASNGIDFALEVPQHRLDAAAVRALLGPDRELHRLRPALPLTSFG